MSIKPTPPHGWLQTPSRVRFHAECAVIPVDIYPIGPRSRPRLCSRTISISLPIHWIHSLHHPVIQLDTQDPSLPCAHKNPSFTLKLPRYVNIRSTQDGKLNPGSPRNFFSLASLHSYLDVAVSLEDSVPTLVLRRPPPRVVYGLQAWIEVRARRSQNSLFSQIPSFLPLKPNRCPLYR
jgi:hypothetical protein